MSQKGAAAKVRGEVKEAEDLLAKASTILEQFLAREDLPPEIRQQAQEKKGHVDFEANQRNKAVEAWIKLAEEADLTKSDLKEAGARAAKNAFLASQELAIQFANNPAIQELYGKALTVLFARYADTPFTQRNWYHMGMFQLKATEYAAAAASFEKVQPEHTGSAEALYQLAFSYYKIWRSDAANEDAATKAAQAAEKAIKALEGPAKNNAQLLYMQGDAVLIRGELLTGPLKQPVVARNVLKDFDEKYNKDPDNPDFKRLMYSKRRLMINILVDLGRIDEARSEIEAFTKESPKDAGPIIQSVLLALNEQKETFRLANNPKWKDLAKMGVDIGRYLRDWAGNQPWIAEKPANMLYFDLVVARQFMEAEQFDEAAKLIETLAKQEIGKTEDGKPITAENHKDLIAMRLRLALRLGKDDQVMSIAKDITNRVQDLDDPVYWEAQLAMAQVLDKRYDQMSPEERKEKGAKLYRYILQLRAKNADMGGPITKGKLIRLSEKYKPEP